MTSLAIAGEDFVERTGSLSFAAGQTSKTIQVAVVGDSTFEADETFGLTLAGATEATITDGTAIGTILNDDIEAIELPTLSIADAEKVEGEKGKGKGKNSLRTRAMAFTATLSSASNQTVTLNYQTIDGTALAGSDYLATSGALTFAAGETSKTIEVEIIGDDEIESDETFQVGYSNLTGANANGVFALGTIVNDDHDSLTNKGMSKGNTQKIRDALFSFRNFPLYTFIFSSWNSSLSSADRLNKDVLSRETLISGSISLGNDINEEVTSHRNPMLTADHLLTTDLTLGNSLAL